MSTRPRRQKKQTRLSFEPLPSSSPVKSSYSAAVHDRLASVRFGSSTSPSRKVTRSARPSKSQALPTPEPSSQVQADGENDAYIPIEAVPTLKEVYATQKEDFVESNEVDDDEDDDIIAPSSKRRRISIPEAIKTPSRRSSRLNYLTTPQSHPPLRSGKNVLDSDSSPLPPLDDIGSPESSGDEGDVLVTEPTKRRRKLNLQESEDFFVVSDDFEDKQTKSRAGHGSTSLRGNRATSVDFVVNDQEIEYISGGENDVVSAKRRRGSNSKKRRRSRREQDELNEDLKDLVDSEQDEQDDQEDSAIASRRTRGGPVTTQRDETRKHIKELKRRRASRKVTQVLDSDEESDDQFDEEDGVELDDIGNERRMPALEGEGEDVSSSSDEEQEDEQSLGALNIDYENEDDFVVYDEDNDFQHHRRPQAGIPLAFTSFASSKPRELFVHIIEWLVKNKIAPAFSRDDELYTLSWNKINDQIKAQAGSRLISSAWNEDFKNAILARPEMHVTYLAEGYDEFFLNCDACNKTNHPARYEFKFSGGAYHKDTLEPVDEDEDEDEENSNVDVTNSELDEDDGASYDQAGHLLPSATRTYNLGRFCAANAEMGHKLTHWKHHLNQTLLAYLEEQGVLSAEAIVAREKLNKKKREKEAENIVDMMQDTGTINQMWRDLQNDLEDARFGMEDHIAKNGGRRNKKRIGKVKVH